MVAVPAPNPAHQLTFAAPSRDCIPLASPPKSLASVYCMVRQVPCFSRSTLQARISVELRCLLKNVEPSKAAGISDEGWSCMKRDIRSGISLAAPRVPQVDLTQYINATVKNEQALFKLAKTLHLPLDGRPNQGRWVVGIMYFFISQTEASLRADETWIWDLIVPLRRLAASRASTRPVYCTPFEEAPILHMLHFIKFRNGTRNSRPTLARNLQITRSNTNWDVEDPEAWMDAFIVATMPPPTVDCISRPTMARNPVLGIGVTPPLLLSPSQPIHLFGMERSAV
ncbi:hypothetical protein HMN09_01065200 [Mycena chlorophos]|uniref:Uncharacterized protein n=1 Tax=Mycena chlorophos TaxID=658473 RepID=A0A8H6SBW6_MYCCL|nr:hypothetical protein HMN09_01065200 [Mycena chlorophos]